MSLTCVAGPDVHPGLCICAQHENSCEIRPGHNTAASSLIFMDMSVCPSTSVFALCKLVCKSAKSRALSSPDCSDVQYFYSLHALAPIAGSLCQTRASCASQCSMLYPLRITTGPTACPAGLISNLPAVTRDTFKVQGGNCQVPAGLLRIANASVYEGLAVGRVLMELDGSFQLAYKGQPRQDGDRDRCLAQVRPITLLGPGSEGGPDLLLGVCSHGGGDSRQVDGRGGQY